MHILYRTVVHVQDELLRKEQELQQKIDELRQNQARLEQTKKLKEKTLEDNRRKISELSQDLSTIGSSGDALEGIEQDLAAAVRRGLNVCLSDCWLDKRCVIPAKEGMVVYVILAFPMLSWHFLFLVLLFGICYRKKTWLSRDL